MRLRRGMTLVEMAIAIAVAATMLMIITMAVSKGIQLQNEAEKLSLAVSLAQTKLSQLMSNPALADGTTRGKFGDEGGLYAGYSWEITIRTDRIDLAKVAQEGELKPSVAASEIPTGTQNTVGKTEKNVTGTETGGLVDIIRIVVKIQYPRGGGSGEYRVETFKGAPKKV